MLDYDWGVTTRILGSDIRLGGKHLDSRSLTHGLFRRSFLALYRLIFCLLGVVSLLALGPVQHRLLCPFEAEDGVHSGVRIVVDCRLLEDDALV